MSISTDSVKQLREKTLAPLGACKTALIESNGDFSLAIDWLRKSGALKGATQVDRVAGEGAVTADASGGFGVVLEVNSETDFVARGDKFKDFVGNVLNVAMKRSEGNLETLLTHALDLDGTENGTIGEAVLELAGTIRENIVLRRLVALNVNPGVVVSYVHQSFPDSPKIGRLGVLVALESSAAESDLKQLGKNIAMQIAAQKPRYVSIAHVDSEVFEKEKTFLQDQMKEDAAQKGKVVPEDVRTKMLEGKLQKFFTEIVLEEQSYIHDSKKTVKEVLTEEGKRLGHDIKISAFAYMKLSEAS